MDFEAYQEALNKANNAVFHSHRIFCERVFEFRPGERGIVTNGKVNQFGKHVISNKTAKKIPFSRQNEEDGEIFYWIGKLIYM